MPEGTDTAPEVRTANADELAAMLAMEVRYTDKDASLESFRETFEAHPGLFIVCTDDGELVGEASGRVKSDEVILESIAVVEDRQGEGIGRRVLEYFEEQAEECADRVNVASAANVEGFYRGLGYEPTKILLQVDAEDAPGGDEPGGDEPDGDEPDEYALDEDDEDEPDEDDDRIIEEKAVEGGVTFLYAGFEEYDPSIRRELKAEFGAFEANTIYEKELSG